MSNLQTSSSTNFEEITVEDSTLTLSKDIKETPRRALVLVDVQKEYFDGPLEIQFPPRQQSLAKVLQTIDIAEQEKLPVVCVQHESPIGSPVFSPDKPGFSLNQQVKNRIRPNWKMLKKSFASCFDDTDLAAWCQENQINTLTLVGYMTNNCVLATAASAGQYGLSIEVLSDATGAINLVNEIGSVPAQQLHETLMTLLHSNFAAVAPTGKWKEAVELEEYLPKSNLLASALGL